MYSVNYHRASSLADAAGKAKGDAKYLSGGMTLIPAMKTRLAAPTDVIDLTHIGELKGITVSGRSVTIGAATTHFDVSQDKALKQVCPALSHLASLHNHSKLNNSVSQVLSDGSSAYLYGLDRIAQQNVVGRQYYLGDALGSVRQLVNPAGTVIQAHSYEPFGKQLSAYGNPLSKYAFTGEWQDPTGLIFLRARHHDPATGRFLTKDPVRGSVTLPGTLNPYTYAVNNPVRYTDPSGEFAIELMLGMGLLSGGISSLGNLVSQLSINDWNVSCVNWGDVAISFGVGFVAGFVMPMGFMNTRIMTGIVWSAANMLQYYILTVRHGYALSAEKMIFSGAVGFIGGAVAGPMARGVDRAYAHPSVTDSLSRSTMARIKEMHDLFANINLEIFLTSFLGTTISNTPKNTVEYFTELIR